MIKRNLVIIVLIGIFAQQAWCQEEGPDEVGLPQTSPISPSAAGMSKYENYAVDLSTGVPNISFPLINVSSGDLSVQLSLSYHAGGNRVEDKDGRAGLGWNIVGAGKISRSMRGLPDDSPYGFIGNSTGLNSQSPDQLLDETPHPNLPESTIGYEYRKTLAGFGVDSHSDMYYYSYPGGSGQFYYNNLGEAFTVPYTANKFVRKYVGVWAEGSHVYYEIHAPNGTIYEYKEQVFMRPYGSGRTGAYTDPYVSDYYLTKIISADGLNSIAFEYESFKVPLKNDTSFAKTVKYDPILPPITLDKNSYNISYGYDDKRLSRIIFDEGIVEFDGVELVNNIYLKDSNQDTIKTIDFDYSLFPKEEDCEVDCIRKKLDAFHINDLTYEFIYDELPVPSRKSLDKDHWGFYNGANNTSLLPDIVYSQNIHGDGANRHTNRAYAKFGMLNKVIYPTGGSTEYVFESNDIFTVDEAERHVLTANFYLQGATNIEGHKTQDFNFPAPFVYEGNQFEPDFNSYVEIAVTFAISPKNDDFEQGPEMPTKLPRVQITDNTDIIYDPTGDHNYYEQDDLFVQMVYKEVYITNWDELANLVKLTSSTSEDSYVRAKLTYFYTGGGARNAYNWGVGGMRVASITSKDENRNFIGKRTYSYLNNKEESTAELVKGNVSLFKDLHAYYDYYTINNRSLSTSLATYLGRVILHETPRNGITSGNTVIYGQVTENILNESNLIVGATEYYYSAGQDFVPLTYPANYGTTAPWTKGNLRKTVVKKANETAVLSPVKTTETIYEVRSGPEKLTSYGVNVVEDRGFVAKVLLLNAGSWTMFTDGSDPTRFVWDYYHQTTGIAVPSTTTITEIGSDGTALPEKVITYQYADDEVFFHKLRSTSQENSSGGILKNVTSYSFDRLVESDNLSESKVLVFEKAVLNENDDKSELIGLSRYTYTNDNKIKRVYTKSISNPISNFTPLFELNEIADPADQDDFIEEKRFIYYSGEKQRVKQIIEKGMSSSYLWTNNFTKVIATTLNAMPNECAFTSFENGGDEGNWNFSGEIDSNEYFTGELSHRSNSSINIEVVSGKYLISFWAKGTTSNSKFEIVTEHDDLVSVGISQGQWQYYELEVFGGQLINVVPINIYLDDLRLHPVDAQMTTYTHKSLVGVTSVSDPSNRKQSYEYDDVGRLKYIKDQDGNIITINEYNYINSAN